MTVTVRDLTKNEEEGYVHLLAESPGSLLYHTLQYRQFLRAVLLDARDRYLVALADGQVVGALPAFVKAGPFGAVVNSLPFFGGHGSIVARADAPVAVIDALGCAFDEMCREERAVTATIVDNPFAPSGHQPTAFQADLFDERIAQFSPLPAWTDGPTVAASLMNSFHVKTRNLVRKGCNGKFVFEHSGSVEAMRVLHDLHASNIRALGGRAKPWPVFEAIRECFVYDSEYRVYTAAANQDVAAALLVFFVGTTAEYFTPAVHHAYRSDQPLSGLIFAAMQDAAAKGCVRWNWGGTWLSQSGVYHFKSRWNSDERHYRYFIKEYTSVGSLRQRNEASLLESYPYFYTLPFGALVA